MLSANLLERRLQISGMILILALVLESLCMLGHGPIAFMLFVALGAIFGAGILIYLYSLLRSGIGAKP